MNPYGIKVENQSLARGQADKAQKCPFVCGFVGVCEIMYKYSRTPNFIGKCYEMVQNEWDAVKLLLTIAPTAFGGFCLGGF